MLRILHPAHLYRFNNRRVLRSLFLARNVGLCSVLNESDRFVRRFFKKGQTSRYYNIQHVAKRVDIDFFGEGLVVVLLRRTAPSWVFGDEEWARFFLDDVVRNKTGAVKIIELCLKYSARW